MNRLQEKHAQKFGEPTIKGNWHFLENWGPSELQKLMDSDFSIEDMVLEVMVLGFLMCDPELQHKHSL